MFKTILFVFIFFSSAIAAEKQDKNDEAIGFGGSFGIMSEKIPATFLEMTGFYSPNNNTEIFATLSYLVFGGGIGVGAKYYLKDRKRTSLFISGGYSASIVGDGYDSYVGPHIATGLSISFIEILNRLELSEMFNISINLGAGHVFYGDTDSESGWYPFLNGQCSLMIDF